MRSYGFSSSHVQMWELDHKEGWAPKNWCFQIVVLEKTLESPLDCKEIQPVHPKGDQSWMFIGDWCWSWNSNTLVTWWELTHWKDPDAGKDWRWEEKGMPEDEMVGWHHWLNGYEFEQALGVGDGQGSLVCCSPWGSKELDTTERLNWTEGLLILMSFSNPFCLVSGGFVAAPPLLAFVWVCPLKLRECHAGWCLVYKKWGTVRPLCPEVPHGSTQHQFQTQNKVPIWTFYHFFC